MRASSSQGKTSFEGEISFEGKTSFEGETSCEGETSFKSSQDQLRVEHEARVDLWSSLLVGGSGESCNNQSNAGHLY